MANNDRMESINLFGCHDAFTYDGLLEVMNHAVSNVPEDRRHTVRFEIQKYWEQYDPSEYVSMFMTYTRPETPAEQTDREAQEAEYRALSEKAARAELERLTKMFAEK